MFLNTQTVLFHSDPSCSPHLLPSMTKQLFPLWVMWLDSVFWVLWRPLRPQRQICGGRWDGCSRVQGYGAEEGRADNYRVHPGLGGLCFCVEESKVCPAKAECSWQCFVLNPQGLDICLKSFALNALSWLETGPCCLLLRVYVPWRRVCLCTKESINGYIRQSRCLLRSAFVFGHFVFIDSVRPPNLGSVFGVDVYNRCLFTVPAVPVHFYFSLCGWYGLLLYDHSLTAETSSNGDSRTRRSIGVKERHDVTSHWVFSRTFLIKRQPGEQRGKWAAL